MLLVDFKTSCQPHFLIFFLNRASKLEKFMVVKEIYIQVLSCRFRLLNLKIMGEKVAG